MANLGRDVSVWSRKSCCLYLSVSLALQGELASSIMFFSPGFICTQQSNNQSPSLHFFFQYCLHLPSLQMSRQGRALWGGVSLVLMAFECWLVGQHGGASPGEKLGLFHAFSPYPDIQSIQIFTENLLGARHSAILDIYSWLLTHQ